VVDDGVELDLDDRHLHAAVKLNKRVSCAKFAQALRTRGLRVHVSETHTEFWSCVRYVHFCTSKKPEVDQHPWTVGCSRDDLFRLAQRRFNAKAHVRAYEKKEREAGAGDKNKPPAKMSTDVLVTIILDRDIKTEAALRDFGESMGTDKERAFIRSIDLKGGLKRYLDLAEKCRHSKADAERMAMTPLQIVEQVAQTACPEGTCTYLNALRELYTKQEQDLPSCLQDIYTGLRDGHDKEGVRVLYFLGTSHIGKSFLPAGVADIFCKHGETV
jgi:hypothetical protein